MVRLEYQRGSELEEECMSEQDDSGERRTKLVKAGVAVGIGSAAIVAALMYASKVKKPKGKS
jgi:hypothetical protein